MKYHSFSKFYTAGEFPVTFSSVTVTMTVNKSHIKQISAI